MRMSSESHQSLSITLSSSTHSHNSYGVIGAEPKETMVSKRPLQTPTFFSQPPIFITSLICLLTQCPSRLAHCLHSYYRTGMSKLLPHSPSSNSRFFNNWTHSQPLPHLRRSPKSSRTHRWSQDSFGKGWDEDLRCDGFESNFGNWRSRSRRNGNLSRKARTLRRGWRCTT